MEKSVIFLGIRKSEQQQKLCTTAKRFGFTEFFFSLTDIFLFHSLLLKIKCAI